MIHQLEFIQTWKTKDYHSLRTRPWVCTAQFGTQMTGPHKGVGSRRTGPMQPSFIATYSGFEIDACEVPGSVAANESAKNRSSSGVKRYWWDEPTWAELN
uniref:Uncharacterized protein n=1 Tax=Quercus lobata TaxID=97700 RepID=A0A7N2MW89_QUELO